MIMGIVVIIAIGSTHVLLYKEAQDTDIKICDGSFPGWIAGIIVLNDLVVQITLLVLFIKPLKKIINATGTVTDNNIVLVNSIVKNVIL